MIACSLYFDEDGTANVRMLPWQAELRKLSAFSFAYLAATKGLLPNQAHHVDE